ncbi:dephospho-CoA kinase [Leptothoe spongobia]|uniref:Dephospho-CoA kinase n=1 Tax=Leptothoe spongobia TAU-MAC 1115 TaxID=1967444 RepID=A0A947DG87_9CYAN|nr:dephospho-CoA kinase [Leptothoe spongobia]MBT9316008.1 dephospho-CoA kinase [Leptothoe spongobia TAU-MAC 1115]
MSKSENRRIIGLTGGIATGKTIVSDYLATTHQLPILDADIYAREAVAVGSPILTTLEQRYGNDILLADGGLNRPQLGTIIFSHPTEKQWVEQQIHPFVRQRFTQVSREYPPTQTLVYAIPLLFEANLTHLVSEIWVVTCRPEQQQQRLRTRNHLSQSEAAARINNQLPLSQKVAQADYVLDNSTDLAALHQQIDHILVSK